MIRAKHTEPWNSFLQWFVRRKLKRHFSGPELHTTGAPPQSPVLLIVNHFSWWDGFFALEANKRFFHKKMHVMMLEEELKKRPFLSHAGAFSIDPGHRSALESLQYAAGLLGSGKNMLVLFPQGEMRPFYEHPLTFQKGWARVLDMAVEDYRIFFQVNIPVYGAAPRPKLEIHVQAFNAETGLSVKTIEDAFNAFLAECLRKGKQS